MQLSALCAAATANSKTFASWVLDLSVALMKAA
jgi:hypothetical protein